MKFSRLFFLIGFLFLPFNIGNTQLEDIDLPACRVELESCIKTCGNPIENNCLRGCLDGFDVCTNNQCIIDNNLCNNEVENQKNNCIGTCTTNFTDINGNYTDKVSYFGCYETCGQIFPFCPHISLCSAADQSEYAGCERTCQGIPSTDPLFDSCLNTCKDAYPFCEYTNWTSTSTSSSSTPSSPTTPTSPASPSSPATPSTPSSPTTPTSTSTSGTDSSTSASTSTSTSGTASSSSTSTSTGDNNTSSSTSTSTSTGTSGTFTSSSTTGTENDTSSSTSTGIVQSSTSTASGGENENFCKSQYGLCNNVCDTDHIINGVTQEPDHSNCGNRCADSYSSCLGNTPPECEPQLDACYSMCETEYDFIEEDCFQFSETSDFNSCLARNQANKEAKATAKTICIVACRTEFSQCVEPERVFPKRPDIGPNSCTPLGIQREFGSEEEFQQENHFANAAQLSRDNNDFARLSQIPNTGRPDTSILTDELLDRYHAQSLFADLSAYSPSYTPFATLLLQGIMRGYDDGTLRPNEVITRAELFKVILHSQQELLLQNCASYYDDVEPGSWYEPYINRAHELGFLYPDGNYAHPSAPVHLQEFLLITARAFEVAHGGYGDNPTQFQGLLNEKQLLPLWLASEDNHARWITRTDLAEVAYRYIQMQDTNDSSYLEEVFLTIPDFGIENLPIARSLLSEPSSWLPATLNGGAYYSDPRPETKGNLVLYGHATYDNTETIPALRIFEDVAQKMTAGQQIIVERDGTLEVYEVTNREIVSGLDVNALSNYHTDGSDGVFFVCHTTPWERVLLKLKQIK